MAGEIRVNVPALLRGSNIPPSAGQGFSPQLEMQREMAGFRMLVVGVSVEWLLL